MVCGCFWRVAKDLCIVQESFSAVTKEEHLQEYTSKIVIRSTLFPAAFQFIANSLPICLNTFIFHQSFFSHQIQQFRILLLTKLLSTIPTVFQEFGHTSTVFCPLNFIIFRYNMRKCEGASRQPQSELASEENYSQDQDCAEQAEIEEALVSEHKIDELQNSVVRLREFVGTLPAQQVVSVPQCVEEYCDKMGQYRVRSANQVEVMGQRRLNKMLRNRKIKRNWNNEDISLLVWLVSKQIQLRGLSHFSELTKEHWEFIAQLISGSTWQKCKFRWLSLKKVKLVTHKWSKLESKLLAEAIAQTQKRHWKLISQKLYERNHNKNKVFRTAKQCREHWNCFLNPNIQKGPWTLQEDRRLLEYVLELEGSKKWSQISKFMDGRTENALKNRFNLLVNRQRKVSGHLTEKRLVKICLNRLMLEQGQQEQLQMPSPIAMQSIEENRSVAQRDVSPGFRPPLVPTVLQPMHYQPNQLTFGNGFQNFFGYLNPSMGLPPNSPIYFSILFPNQFLSP